MVFEEMLDIIQGMVAFLPGKTACIAIGVALFLLMGLHFRIGMLSLFLILSYLFMRSFIAGRDLYSIGLQRAAAGIILGAFLFFVDVYFLVRIIAGWED